MPKSLILNNQEIQQKLDRIASEILEHFYGEKSCIIIGLNERGFALAKLLNQHLDQKMPTKLAQLIINQEQCQLNALEATKLKNESVLIVDDVLESGRTLMKSAAFVMAQNPKQVKTIILVDRMHPKFPIKADFVGLTLSTTLQNHVEVEFKSENINAYLM